VDDKAAAASSDATEDRSLAERCASGDAEALGILYDRHGAACYRVALAVSTNVALAEEIVQEVFLAFWQRGSYDHRLGSMRAFLCALAHHKAVDAVRRESALSRREQSYGGRNDRVEDDSGEPEAALLASLRSGAVREALGLLPPDQREAIVLAYFAGRSQREIAELTEVPIGTVKTRTFNGLRRLQALLKVPGGEIGDDVR
jgi:RNA polymerase sigma factor (sigma-70 family)